MTSPTTDRVNWVDAESDPKGSAAVAKVVSSEEWTFFETHYYDACCDCGLAHRVDVRTVPGGYEVRNVRMDEYTAELRKQRHFPLAPCSSAGARVEPVGSHYDDDDREWPTVPLLPDDPDDIGPQIEGGMRLEEIMSVVSHQKPSPEAPGKFKGCVTCGSTDYPHDCNAPGAEECQYCKQSKIAYNGIFDKCCELERRLGENDARLPPGASGAADESTSVTHSSHSDSSRSSGNTAQPGSENTSGDLIRQLRDWQRLCEREDRAWDANLLARAALLIEKLSPSPEPSARCAVCDHLEELHAPFNLQHAFVAKSPAEPSVNLERYGCNHNHGPHDPLMQQMPDGYWTPWHIADAALRRLSPEPEAILADPSKSPIPPMKRFAAHIEAALRGRGSIETMVTSEDARDLRALLKVAALQSMAIEQHKKLYAARGFPGEPDGDVADKLWQMCVKDGWPWSDGSIQDKLTSLGLLYPKDMTQEDESEQCTNCEGDCRTCYRAVEHVRDAKPLPETKSAKP